MSLREAERRVAEKLQEADEEIETIKQTIKEEKEGGGGSIEGKIQFMEERKKKLIKQRDGLEKAISNNTTKMDEQELA